MLTIYNSQNISGDEFGKIYTHFTNNSSITFASVNGACFVEICGYMTLIAGIDSPLPDLCHRYSDSQITLQDEEFKHHFKATSLQYGCKNDALDCDWNCETPFSDITSSPTACAVLFRERNCNSCEFKRILLNHDENFTAGPGVVIHSVLVNDHCDPTLIETGYTYDSAGDFRPFNITHTHGGINLRYSSTRKGKSFYCVCNKIGNEEGDELSQDNTNTGLATWSKILIGCGSAVLILGGSGTILCLKRRITDSKKLGADKVSDHGIDTSNQVSPQLTEPPTLQSLPPYFESLEIPRESIEFDTTNPESVLGHGMFGVVYKGKLQTRGEQLVKIDVAIKTVKVLHFRDDDDNSHINSILNELKVLKYIGEHPNIVHLHGAWTRHRAGGEIFIVLELCDNGSLKRYLETVKETMGQKQSLNLQQHAKLSGYLQASLSPDLVTQFLIWSKDVATGMDFLAQKGVLHVDLATRNILLDKNLKAKIGDFGLSRKLYNKLYVKPSEGLMPKINALESFTENRYSVKSDIWAYGITLWEIYTLADDPYSGLGYREIVEFLLSGQRLPQPPYSSEELYQLMLRCWSADLEDRPFFSDICKVLDSLLEKMSFKKANTPTKNE